MNRLRLILLSDWRRKLVALFFAVLLWGWLVGRIEVERDLLLRVAVTTSDGITPNENELLVQVPKGWALITPEPDTAISIHLVGTPSVLKDFTARQCAARFQAVIPAGTTQDRIDLSITPNDLDWLRPNDAAYLLDKVDGKQELQVLTFERVMEKDWILTASEQPVRGQPSPVHEMHPEEMVFTPTQVRLSGPKSVMTALMNQLDEAHSVDGEVDHVDLLSPLVVEPIARGDIRAVVHLHPSLIEQGLTMEPEEVLVTMPVRLAQPVTITWLPSPDSLQVLQAPAESGEWEAEPWTPTAWKAVLPDLPAGTSDVTEAWVREHVVFVLPLNVLGPESLERTELDLVPVLTGLTPDDHRFYSANLQIEPVDDTGWTVTVTRIP
jgi:hypothetical protein